MILIDKYIFTLVYFYIKYINTNLGVLLFYWLVLISKYTRMTSSTYHLRQIITYT